MADLLKRKFIIPQELGGERLDKALSFFEEIPSRSQALRLLELGQISSKNGKILKPSYRVTAGEQIEISLTAPPSKEIQALAAPLNIVYEDNELLVLNKPSGLVVHPAAGHRQDTLVNILLHHIPDLRVGFHEHRPGIVHRLDKETSGLMVIAKTLIALENLALQFRERKIHRVYWAMAHGRFKKKQGSCESLLLRHPTQRKRFASHLTQGKRARTDYSVKMESSANVSLVHLKLWTGRTHQIRVHLSELGHPLVGDHVYGSKKRDEKLSSSVKKHLESIQRFALHAAELGFKHPVTKEDMFFELPWPQDLQSLFDMFQFKKNISPL